MKKVELLSPAGDLEKLKFALAYGADAVYFAGNKFGLRAFAGNFSEEDILEAVKLCHQQNKKAYVTVNIYPHNSDLEGLEEYLLFLSRAKVDALIVADPGVFRICKNTIPDMPIHISTQATLVNWSAVKFWEDFDNVKCAVLARELSFTEIAEIKKQTSLKLEVFIHGAICISYSGRCLLSHYMTGRDANKGACSQPCRWKYALVEEKRPGEYYNIEEDEHGSYIFNSEDLCLASQMPTLIDIGVDILKIEGRMKSLYYVATVTRAYRNLIDAYYISEERYNEELTYWLEELEKISHRPYTEGLFLQGVKGGQSVNLEHAGYIGNYEFIGIVKDYDPENKVATIEQRNKFSVNEKIEIFGPYKKHQTFLVNQIYNEAGELIDSANQAQQIIQVPIPFPVEKNDLLRKKLND